MEGRDLPRLHMQWGGVGVQGSGGLGGRGQGLGSKSCKTHLPAKIDKRAASPPSLFRAAQVTTRWTTDLSSRDNLPPRN
jgi:hypothetical protein